LIRVIKKTQKGGYYRNLRESIIIELREESEKIKKETEVARKKTEDNVKRFLQMDRQDLKDYITTLNKNTQDTPEKRDELFILKQVERIHDTRDTQANQVDIKPFEAEVTANDLLC
jgi:predicted solute-binding protein